MKLRNALGLAVTASALVLTAVPPANAASQAVVSYTGTFQITPSSAASEQLTRFCFSAVASCPNDVASTGVVAGPGLSPASPRAIDGLYVEAKYTESCLAGALAPAGSAELRIMVHDALSGTWSAFLGAGWTRAGEIVLVQGTGVVGVATFTPVGVPACDVPLTVALSGKGVFTY